MKPITDAELIAYIAGHAEPSLRRRIESADSAALRGRLAELHAVWHRLGEDSSTLQPRDLSLRIDRRLDRQVHAPAERCDVGKGSLVRPGRWPVWAQVAAVLAMSIGLGHLAGRWSLSGSIGRAEPEAVANRSEGSSIDPPSEHAFNPASDALEASEAQFDAYALANLDSGPIIALAGSFVTDTATASEPEEDES